jgi:hypothetical protein
VSTRVVLTGGGGYIGSVVTELLCDAGYDVLAWDNLGNGHRVAVDPRPRFVQMDLLDREAVRYWPRMPAGARRSCRQLRVTPSRLAPRPRGCRDGCRTRGGATWPTGTDGAAIYEFDEASGTFHIPRRCFAQPIPGADASDSPSAVHREPRGGGGERRLAPPVPHLCLI